MDVEQEFESRLADHGVEVAGPWIEEWCESHPWDQHAKACRVFIHVLENDPRSLGEVEEILGFSPFNEWALASLFFMIWPKSVGEDVRFLGWDGFRLDPIWIAILWVLGHPIKAYSLYLEIHESGNEEQTKTLSKEFEDIPDRMLEEVRGNSKAADEFEKLADQVATELEIEMNNEIVKQFDR